MSLKSVETSGGPLPIAGGMRIGYTPRGGDPSLPELHAGDEISILAEGRQPLVFKDAGAFDRWEFLARQNIDLLATLRSSKLLEKRGESQITMLLRIARLRGYLRSELDAMFAGRPEVAAILRAMLLGDRSFVDRAESVDFQKTGTFHVLVVAGLHVGALAVFLYWISRKLKLSRRAETILVVAILFSYVAIVEQRD